MPGRTYTPREFEALLEGHASLISGMISDANRDLAEAIAAAARTRAPGRLKGAVTVQESGNGEWVVGVNEQAAGDAKFVMFGTGIYGDFHRVIRSQKHGMPMTVGGVAMFRKSQRGTRKNEFFQDAVDEATAAFPARAKLLGEDVADLTKETP